MWKCLVLFGSTSDKALYNPLMKQLEKYFTSSLEILSAHRKPDALRGRLETKNYDFIIAGAGLAAHLPGVAASLVKCPVIGLPVNACFNGLDALLSILQMPPGVPVQTLATQHAKEDEQYLTQFTKSISEWNKKDLTFVGNEETLQNHPKCITTLTEYGKEIGFSVQKKIMPEHLQSVISVYTSKQSPGVHIPCLNEKQKTQASEALTLQHWIQQNGGSWVGVNSAKNALCLMKRWAEVRS